MRKRATAGGVVLALGLCVAAARVGERGAGAPALQGQGARAARSGAAAEAERAGRRELPGPRAERALATREEEIDGRQVEVAEGELLLQVSEGQGEQGVREALGEGLTSLSPIGERGLYLARLGRGETVAGALERLRGARGVEQAAANAICRGSGDRSESVLWSVDSVDAPSWPLGPGALVALLDSGLAYRDWQDAQGRTHRRAPWLAGVDVRPGFDFVHGDGQPDDSNGHGTHLASVLVGPAGLARGAALLPVQVLDDGLVGSEASLIAGLDQAVASGASVVNMSLSFSAGYYPSRMLDAAVARALSAGVVLVAAVGNDPSTVRFPAAFPGVIAVGAATPSGKGSKPLQVAHYSGRGAALDLLAPGGDLEADRNDDGVPDGVLGDTFDPANPEQFGPWLYAGTSEAAAHVSAAAARLRQAGVPASQVGARLRDAARPAGGHGFDPEAGAGLLDIDRALRPAAPASAAPAVQLTASLGGAGASRVVTVGVAAITPEGERIRKATVHGLWRGGAQGPGSCETDKAGVCWLVSDALVAGPVVASFEVTRLVDKAGWASDPVGVFLRSEEVDPVAARLAKDGPGQVVWRRDEGQGATYLLRGLATALGPQVVVLDEAAYAQLAAPNPDGTGGTGFGSSSSVYYLFSYSGTWFFGGLSSASGGTGFGSSSFGANNLYFSGYFGASWSTGSVTTVGASYGALSGAQFAPGELLGAGAGAQGASVGGRLWP